MSSTNQRTSITPTRLTMQKLVEKIPDDFLSRVFLSIVQDEARHKADERPQYPWTLAFICTRWRKICLDNPALWSQINFPAHYCQGKALERPSLKQIQLQLHRSRNAPLRVYITNICQCKVRLSIWNAIIPHSGRWEELCFGYMDGEEDRFGALIAEGKNTGFANLRHISFDAGTPSDGSYLLPLPGYNSSLTGLRSLTLKSVSGLLGLEDFPWQRLTHLVFDPYEGLFSELFETLSQCQNLTHLLISLDEEYLGMGVEDISEEVERESVAIPSLLSLSLEDHSRDSFLYAIFPFIRLPSLSHLSTGQIDAYVDAADTPYNLLLDFLKRSPSITELSTVVFESDEGLDLSRLLQTIPQLRILAFDGPVETLSEALLEQTDSKRMCPSLRQLKLHLDCSAWRRELDSHVLVSMIESLMGVKNNGSTTPVKSLHILYSSGDADTRNNALDGVKAALMDTLKQHTSDGLELRFAPFNSADDES